MTAYKHSYSSTVSVCLKSGIKILKTELSVFYSATDSSIISLPVRVLSNETILINIWHDNVSVSIVIMSSERHF